MKNERADVDETSTTSSSEFIHGVKQRHRALLKQYNRFRQTISGILLLNADKADQTFSRDELIQRKKQLHRDINNHIEIVQNVLLPALSSPEHRVSVSVDVLATKQNRLQELLDAAMQHLNGLLEQYSSRDQRRNVARKVLLDIFRIDSLLKVYLEIVEKHYIPLGNKQLDSDEKEEFLSGLTTIN